MVRVHLTTDMFQTPFAHPDARARLSDKHGVVFSASPLAADVIVGPTLRRLAPYRAAFPLKRFLVWSNEPNWEHTAEKVKAGPLGLAATTVFNVYTGVFRHNLQFLGTYHFDPAINPGTLRSHETPHITVDEFQARAKTLAGFFSFTPPARRNGPGEDLRPLRVALALEGDQRGICDIYGGGWPAGMAKEESRTGIATDAGKVEWWDRKLEALREYRFSIALENTAFPNYCTEKLWHSAIAQTLPIYYGKNTNIYETFPKDSFLDASDFSSPGALLDHLLAMPAAEAVGRINLCIDVLNREAALRRADVEDDLRAAVDDIAAALSSRRAQG